MKGSLVAATLAFFVIQFYPLKGSAQDRLFNYTYQSPVLGSGMKEIEVWNTVRAGKVDFYRALDTRLEFEIGLGGNLQTAFYVNIGTASAPQSTVQYDVSGSQPVAKPVSSIATEMELSFSNEWKLKLADPVADPIGIALYGEYTIGSKEVELEPRLILDKELGGVLVAFNGTAEFEFERRVDENGTEETARELGLEFALAGSLPLGEHVHAGIEVIQRNILVGGDMEVAALFAGPTVSYANQEFWINVTALPQLVGFKGATADNLVLTEFERAEVRVVFSYGL